MSRWMIGKVCLKCSLSQLQNMLERIKPCWKGHIQSDPNGKLTCHRGENSYNNQKEGGYSLIVPGTSNKEFTPAPNMWAGDLGFRKAKDGTWEFRSSGIPSDKDNLGTDRLINALKKEYAIETVIQKAKLNNAILITEESEDGKKKLIFHVPVKERYKLTS